MIRDQLKQYEKFFKLLRRDQEKKFEEYALTSLSSLFERGRAFYGDIIRVSEYGHLMLKFKSPFKPRLKTPLSLCVLRDSAYTELGEEINKWDCSSIKFRESNHHTSFSDVLPIYYHRDKNTIGCGQVNFELLKAIGLALKSKPNLSFIILENLPPTELLLNLCDYIHLNSDNEYLNLKPIKQYSDWKPIELKDDADVSSVVINQFETNDICILQGPPGTGKSYNLGKIISDYTASGKSVCVTTQSNASLISLVKQETLMPLIKRGHICKTVLSLEEKKKYPFLNSADKNMLIENGGLLCSTYYSLSKIINQVTEPIYDLIVIEEASQAYLTAIAAFLKLGRKCLIIGDPMQLPPIVDISNRLDYQGIDIDTQVNGMRTFICSMDVPCFRLTTSYRLTPQSASQTKIFYNDNLSSKHKEQIIFNVPDKLSPFFPIEGGTILYNTQGCAGGDCSQEALDLMKSIEDIFQKYYPKRKLAILSPYIDTTNILQEEFCKETQSLDILVETVSRIQGATVDYTIYYIPSRNFDFAFSDNLFNVATSRSRSTTLIITDMPIDTYPIKSINVRTFLSSCKYVDFDSSTNIDRQKIKKYYPGLEHIVDILIDNNVSFSYEGDSDLLDYNEIVIASAGLIISNPLIAIDPVDADSKSIFESAGYKVVSSSDFNISMLR